jgi:hypothetical protein
MNPNGNGRSVIDIVRDLLAETSTLLRKEGQLARAEISEKLDQAVRGLVYLIGGAVLLMPALVVLLGAAVAAMVDAGVEAPRAALTVGGVALLVGLVLLVLGVRAFKLEQLKPSRTIEHVQRDVSMAKHQMRQHHEIERAA